MRMVHSIVIALIIFIFVLFALTIVQSEALEKFKSTITPMFR